MYRQGVATHAMDHRYVDPSFAAARIGFVILAETPIAPQPGKGPFYNPTLWQNNKMMEVYRFENGRQQPVTPALHPVGDGCVGAVRPDDAQPRQAPPHLLQQRFGRIAILHVGGEHHQSPDQAQRVDEQVPLAPAYFLGPVPAMDPPFSVVLTLWLSTTTALGVGSRPSRTRSRSRSTARIFSQRPSSRQMRQ